MTKAESTRVPEGVVINVQPALSERARVLSGQLDQEVEAALAELAEQAASAYASIAEKASRNYLHRLVGRVMRALSLQTWINDRLMPILRNHAGRVVGDTRRTLQTEVGLEMHVAEEQVQEIAEQAGQHLGMRDIEPQVRQAILQAVRQGLAAGENPTKTAQRIKSLVPAGRFVHAGPGYRARLIALEETRQALRAAQAALYRSNPNITHIELRDGIYGPPRSDDDCIARDGQVVPINEIDQIHPYHIACTLSLNPVVHASLATA